MKHLLAIILTSLSAIAQSQPTPYLNLDFETATRGQVWYWSNGSAGYAYAADPDVVQSGSQSLRISSAAGVGSGTAAQAFPAGLVRGHHVTITGWIKTKDITGSAAIFWRVDGTAGTLSLDNLAGSGPSGTTDWTQYQIDRDVSTDATSVLLGVSLTGAGTAWFDGIQIQIDGVRFVEGAAPYVGEPAADQLSWVASKAIPVATLDPSQPYDDLMPLKQVIGNARIVGLGEATYGTSEFAHENQRIINFLANQMGFTVLSIEANMPEAYRLNGYVSNGIGNPVTLLSGLNNWAWNTQEFSDTIYGMRDFNQSGKAQMQFTGFDMTSPDASEQIVQDFVAKADPGYATQVSTSYGQIQQREAIGQAFGYVADQFPVGVASTKHVKFSGYVKTQDVTVGSAYLYWQCTNSSNNVVAFGTSSPSANGTNDWRQVAVELDVPASTSLIIFGGLLSGDGTAWFDSYAIEVDGQPYINNAAYDFDFESFFLRSRYTFGAGYKFGLDNTVAHTGKQSLKISYVNPVPLVTDIAAAAADVVTHLEASRDGYLAAGLAATDVDWATQNARIVAQAEDLAATGDGSVRARDMAANIAWILDHAPAGTKIVLLAQGFNVSRASGAMGSYLDAKYGKDYVAIGSAFNQGAYNANGPQAVTPFTASESFAGSAEYVFHQTGIPQFILDLRQATADDPASAWLLQDFQFRTIGSVPWDGFSVTHLAHDYDALMYFETSTPSTLLPF